MREKGGRGRGEGTMDTVELDQVRRRLHWSDIIH